MHTTLRNHHLTARRSLAALSTAAALTLGLVTGPTPAAQAVPVDGSVTTTDTNTAPDTSGVTPLYRAPRHRLVTTRDKLKVSVYEYGPSARTAETIVMTGGWPWNSSGMEPFAQVLATKFHVVRYDQRGSGQSSHPEDSNLYTMERLADEMLDVIHATTLPRQKVHVFGEAWCPFIAAQLTWPELNLGIPWLSYGRLRPLHTNAVIFAFAGNAIFANYLQIHHVPGVGELAVISRLSGRRTW